MKVFIVGKYNTFINELIKKLHKEDDKIYVLTGEKYFGKKPHRVFEQYTFPYTGDSIIEVLDSVQPDVVIFSGAYDSNFQWKNVRSESMHYMSGLINLIMSAEMHQIKHFVYLSSNSVFETNSDSPILPGSKTTATEYTGLAIAQGEELCKLFNETTQLDISILRIDNLYKTPSNLEEVNDICSKLCLEALCNGAVEVNVNRTYSMIHVSDAVFGIYQYIHAKKRKNSIYHLTSGEQITDSEIVRIIQSIDQNVAIKDATSGQKVNILLDGTDFNDEFQFRVFNQYEPMIEKIYKTMRKNRKKFLGQTQKKENKNGLFNRLKALFFALLPFIENLILFIPVFMINNRTVGSGYFDKLDVFVLYVLLFAGVYGTKQAIFSATLSVIGYCFRQLYTQTGIDLLIDHNTYLWIAQLFIIAMAVGRLRDSTKVISYEKDEEITFLSGQLDDLVHINESNNRIKNIYQNRILDYDDSLVKIYNITSKLDTLEAGAVLFYAADTIGEILGTKDVAIYQIANADYCRLFSATSDLAKSLGKSLKYSDMTDMIQAINNHQVYVNKTMNEDYPLLASAIYRQEKPIEIIMLWGLPFEKMTRYQCNLLTVLGYMIYNSVERADRYLEAMATTRFIPNTKILAKDAFEELYATYHDAMEQGFTEFTVLRVSINQRKTYTEWSNLLSSKLRLTDYLGINNQNQICILLTNSSLQDAQFIINRFAELGVTCTPI